MKELRDYLPYGESFNKELTHNYMVNEIRDILTYGDNIYIKSAFNVVNTKELKPKFGNSWGVYHKNRLILNILPYRRNLLSYDDPDAKKMGSRNIYDLQSDTAVFITTHYHHFNKDDLYYMWDYFFLDFFCFTNLMQQITNFVCAELNIEVKNMYFDKVDDFYDDRINVKKNIIRPELLSMYREICDLKKNEIGIKLYEKS